MSIQDINKQIEILNETKSQIKQAIISKGQPVTAEDSFRSYATKIENISTLNVQEKIVTPTTSQQIIVPDQDYNALSQVTVEAVDNTVDNNIQENNIKKGVTILGVMGNNDVVDTADATAIANDIVFPKTAYVQGQKVTGRIIPVYQQINPIMLDSNMASLLVSAGEDLFYAFEGTVMHIFKNVNDTLLPKASLDLSTYSTTETYISRGDVSVAKNGIINAVFQNSSSGWNYFKYDDSNESLTLIAQFRYGGNAYNRYRFCKFPETSNEYVFCYGCEVNDDNSIRSFYLTANEAQEYQIIWQGRTHGYMPENLHLANNDTLLVYDRALLDQPDTKCPYYWNVNLAYQCSNESTNSVDYVGTVISLGGKLAYKDSKLYNVTYIDSKPNLTLIGEIDKTIYGVADDTYLLAYIGNNYYVYDKSFNIIMGPEEKIIQARNKQSINILLDSDTVKYIENSIIRRR